MVYFWLKYFKLSLISKGQLFSEDGDLKSGLVN